MRMLADLEWLGITFDEGEGIGGGQGPYRQSAREEFYKAATDKLIASNFCYRCFCRPERIEKMRQENSNAGKPPRYDQNCKNMIPEEIAGHLNRGDSFVVRLSIDNHKIIQINDLVKGPIVFDGDHLDDPILVRSDGSPTGLLAGAVDDQAMGVTHIFRGDEWLPSTPYQYRIFEGLGGPIPEWGHLSLLVDESHAKLSKRTAGLSIEELREEGILPEAICRYLAGLGRGTIPVERGWSLNDLASDFHPSKYRSGEIVYSKPALLTENQKYLQYLSSDELLKRFLVWCGDKSPFADLSPDKHSTALSLSTESASTFSECLAGLNALLKIPELSSIQIADYSTGQLVLTALKRLLSTCEWTEQGIQDILKATGNELGLKGRELYFPIRIAFTGQTHGPKLAALMILIGKEECLKRLDNFLNYFFTPQSPI